MDNYYKKLSKAIYIEHPFLEAEAVKNIFTSLLHPLELDEELLTKILTSIRSKYSSRKTNTCKKIQNTLDKYLIREGITKFPTLEARLKSDTNFLKTFTEDFIRSDDLLKQGGASLYSAFLFLCGKTLKISIYYLKNILKVEKRKETNVNTDEDTETLMKLQVGYTKDVPDLPNPVQLPSPFKCP
eukprot:TRINITY_DN7461_c0_g1_i1.p1 TRINITY_DN7461_c0_g1~~TRINITY_DN7461_c0_g1_i1.p1  ORF type:complete len:185 (+),score=18.80 TRINITY_DN7461_c0_g1_i1:87-641(+)